KPEQRPAREAIVDSLSKLMTIEKNGQQVLLDNADVLDSVVCVLAGADFLLRKSLAPVDLPTAKKEGWIWVRDPIEPPARNPADRTDGNRKKRGSRRSSA
ncbi:MAG TPA: hypothetical protein VLE27_12275, partial [Thermoanaerobaculia bacterium]|nr:hypothetical protein [Thermoanaerobaculia bacterium]